MQTGNIIYKKNNLAPERFKAEYFLYIVAVLLTINFFKLKQY